MKYFLRTRSNILLQICCKHWVGIASPLVGIAIIMLLTTEVINEPSTDSGGQGAIMGALALIMASPFTYFTLLGSGLATQRNIEPSRWLLFTLFSFFVTLFFSLTTLVAFTIFQNTATESAREIYIFLPAIGVIAAPLVSIPAHLVWGLLRYFTSRSY